jgi:DNA-binding response OmpR family regulator
MERWRSESGSRFPILANDDNSENLDLITAALASENLEILTATDPEVGFNTFLRLRPRTVLLDLVMPKVGGMELLERIVGTDTGVDGILITAHYSTDSAVEAIQKGACDYLTKPLNVEKLRSRVASLLREADTRQMTLRLDQELLDAVSSKEWSHRCPTFSASRRLRQRRILHSTFSRHPARTWRGIARSQISLVGRQ